ncbi:GAF and ANTAR domain-containing protein [Patescibacteria group bacterium]|nr:GAF and ANTAR domain-containing protein [Patescibacteria group bacterium]
MLSQNFSSYVEALSKVSKAISSDLYLEDILRLVVTVTAEVMKSKIVSLMLLDEKREKLIIRATQSISEEYNKKPPLKIGEGIAGKVVEENKPIAIYDVFREEEYKYKDIAQEEGLCSLLCVPLNVKGKIIGVVNCYTSVPHRFTSTEINVLTSVANQAAIAIENTDLMVRTKVIQEELEARKLVERAKDTLVEKLKISGEEAYRRIQKKSMNMRKPMRKIAEAIILASEIES